MGNSWLAYRTTKEIRIDYWQAGLGYYMMAIGVFLFYFIQAFNNGDYMLRVPVRGQAVAYADTSTHEYFSCVASNTCSTVRPALLLKDYCRATTHNYHFTNDFKYFSGDEAGSGNADPVGPECRFASPNELVTKEVTAISMTTVYTEEQKFGWPQGQAANCAAVGTAFAQTAISQCSSVPYADPTTGQCECEAKTSVFPSQVEDYSIVLEHDYTVSDLGNHPSWTANSGESTSTLDTYIVGFPNGTSVEYKAGSKISLTIKEILAMAEQDDGTIGLKLDDTNDVLPADMRSGVNTKPKFRHSGITIDFVMTYTNRRGNELVISNKDVDAEIKVKLAPKGWRSVGPSYFYPTYPVGDLGSQTFHSVMRYPQDIRINFATRGYAYAFDPMKVIHTIVDLVVLVGVARTIMDFIVFYCLPNGVSLVLRNKRSEYTSRKAAFRELGIKAAVSVQQFSRLDDEKAGKLNLAELVKVFGEVKNVDRDRAMMIARTILGDSDGIDFEDFMTMAHGDAITFKEYLKLVKNTGGDLNRLSLFQKEQAMKAYADVEKGVTLPEETDAPPPRASASSSVQAVVAPQPVMPAGVVKLMCHSCKRAFGVPAGAKMVACPHCAAVNNCQTVVQPM